MKSRDRELEVAQLTAMSHPGTRISSLTKAHRHQRAKWVCVGVKGKRDDGQTQHHDGPLQT